MTTLPAIDVDFAVPSASIEVGMPTVDVMIPGLTGPAGSTSKIIVFGNAGTVPPAGGGEIPFYPRVEGDVVRVTAAVSDQTGGVTRVDVDISGVSVYTDQAQRPNLSLTGQHFDDGGTIGNGHFTPTDYITVVRDSVGAGAKNLIVTVEYEPI